MKRMVLWYACLRPERCADLCDEPIYVEECLQCHVCVANSFAFMFSIFNILFVSEHALQVRTFEFGQHVVYCIEKPFDPEVRITILVALV